MLRAVLFGLVLLFTNSSGAIAQPFWTVPKGTWLRVTYAEDSLGEVDQRVVSGSLIDLDSDFISLETSPTIPPLVLSLERVAGVELRTAKSQKERGALIGFAAGATVGVLIGYATGDDPSGMVSFSAGEKAAILAVIFAPIGTVLGLVGAPGDQWRSLSINSYSIGSSGSGKAVNGLSVSLYF